jgi:hypothetical protein
MDIKEQQQLCEFIKQQYDNYGNLSNAQEPFNIQGLVLYINPLKTNYIFIKEKNNIVDISFRDIDYEDPYAIFSMPLKDFIPTLNYMYNDWENITNENVFKKYDKNISEMNKEVDYIKNYLQSYECLNPATHCSTIYIKSFQGGTHKLEIGDLVNSGGKKTKINSIGILDIPINFAFENYKFIKSYIHLPCWEIDKYPYVKNFLDIPQYAHSLKNLLPLLKDNAPEAAKDLFYYILDSKVANKTVLNHKNKI